MDIISATNKINFGNYEKLFQHFRFGDNHLLREAILSNIYNPVYWNTEGKPPDDYYFIGTDKSFIFKIDEDQPDKSILSRVRKPKYAIQHSRKSTSFPHHEVCEMVVDFVDLNLYTSDGEPYYTCCTNPKLFGIMAS